MCVTEEFIDKLVLITRANYIFPITCTRIYVIDITFAYSDKFAFRPNRINRCDTCIKDKFLDRTSQQFNGI